MSETTNKIAIVTPVHNRRELTLLCLRSLERIDREGLEISTYIVDDGSTDGTAEAINKEFPHVNVVAGDGSLWFTEGTNVGVRAALEDQPDYVLMINDDTVFDAGFLKSMIKTAEENPKSVVGALLLLWDTPHKVFQVSPKWDVWAGGWRHWQHQTVWTVPDRPWEVGIIVGNCVLVPIAAIKEFGLMDSARYPNFGDAEYTPRMRKNGWKLLIDPHARAFCQPNNIPVKFRSLGFKKQINALWTDLGNIHDIRRRFFACVSGAPSFLQGTAAFSVFLFRLLLRRNVESPWAEGLEEPPLAKTFSNKVV